MPKDGSDEKCEVISIAALAETVGTCFADVGMRAPRQEARWLVCAALEISAARLVAEPDYQVSGDAHQRVLAWCARRAKGEPLWRIVGWREFYGRAFALSDATLEPRPDSETLIDATLDYVRKTGQDNAALRILDVGTGTGCLLLTLLAELPYATGLGTDISALALACAKDNALALGVEARAQWVCTSGLENVPGQFDILISNPPYIPHADIKNLDQNVRAYDPRAALDGGEDGLVVYRQIARRFSEVLPGGFLIF